MLCAPLTPYHLLAAALGEDVGVIVGAADVA